MEEKLCSTGRRKEAVARVRLAVCDKPNIVVNHRTLEKYFAREDLRIIVKQPLALTQTVNKFAVIANVRGGGERGQAEAIRHAISRALLLFNEAFKSILKQHKLLTRDPRMKERKKYGQEGARRRFQFSKR